MEPSAVWPLAQVSPFQREVTAVASAVSSARSPFMLPELDQLMASHLDRVSLAQASRVCKLWHSIFNPVLWRQLSLKHHAGDDDDDDEDFHFVSRRTVPATYSSSLPSMPSSCSSTWSSAASFPPKTGENLGRSLDMTLLDEGVAAKAIPTAVAVGSPSSSSSLIPSPVTAASLVTSATTLIPGLTLLQHVFLYTSRNKVLKGLVRHGHLVQELKGTGITDQEMALIGVLCPNLRVLELIGGRYTSENLSELFEQRQESLQIVRFRSCVLLKDIFQPLTKLSNLREFELYGSFVGNTITSPYFFKQDLFPMLAACPLLRAVLIEQVYIVDQEVDQDDSDNNNNDADMRWHSGAITTPNHVRDNNGHPLVSSSLNQHSQQSPSLTEDPSLSSTNMVKSTSTTSMLSAQLKSLAHDPPSLSPACAPFSRPRPVSSLKSLILECGDIPDSVIRALLTRCPQLEQLSLDWSRELSDETLTLIPDLCPKLTEVSFCRCIQLTSEGFGSFFRALPNLTSIELKGNVLSDGTLEELARSCPFLDHLNLSSCQNVTDLGIQSLLLNCAALSFLSLRFINGLSSVLFDDNTTLATLTRTSPTRSILDRLLVLTPLGSAMASPLVVKREWACRNTLRTLHLPDLVTPSKNVIDMIRQKQLSPHQQHLRPQEQEQEPWQPADGNQLIQARLLALTHLKQLTLGGPQIDLKIVLEGQNNLRRLESLRITRLKHTMTCAEAQWLVDTALPGLLELAIPNFGNRAVREWIEDHRPGLLTVEK
ncbi:hypothetical protein EMPS_11042 [Entomortierella parvispora]|uniref:F-box domain-containing protein n=1 Tax=Entomortierella parvispora TaxID=205924 RepID=A0A9P3M1V3_9FUNG|nr:hypothetical protein EMPS_11042 [Entomortierella parvispora]